MSREAFEHMLAQLKKIQFSSSVCLNVNNEPFMHPDLVWFCERISEELPLADYGFNTNGSLMKHEHFEKIMRLGRQPLVVLNDYTPDHGIAGRVEKWLAEAENPDARFHIFRRSLDEKLSNSAGNIDTGHSWPEDCRDVVCTWPFLSVFLDADLRVFLCCFDYNHEIILGNLNDQSLMDVWQGEPMRAIRHKMLETQRKDLPLCRRCDAVWFHLPRNCP